MLNVLIKVLVPRANSNVVIKSLKVDIFKN